MRLLLVLAAVALCGCARLHSVTYRNVPVLLANGVVTNSVEKTEATVSTLWDSNSSLNKFRNQSSPSSYGSNTFAPGTYMVDLAQASTSTNLNQLAADIAAAVVKAVITSAKP